MKIQSLKFQEISFGFEGHSPLFENVDFDFPMGDVVWVKAESGAGRSSLLQMMAGLVTPEKGRYLINETDVTEMSFEEFLPYRLQIGYGFDFGGLLHNRTLLENVVLPLVYHKILDPTSAQEKAVSYFERLGASRHMNQRPSVVPGGVRKLACLIRALITEPQMLLLDDPSVGLGQETILKYFDLIQEQRNQGKAQHVFVSSFDEKLMSCLPHQEIFIEGGLIHHEMTGSDKKVVSL